MCIDIIEYLPIDPEGTWTNKQLTDWLHPKHGPLPDELALIEGEGQTFKVAVWVTNKHILVALERLREDPEEPWSEDLRGEVLQTFRWTIDAEEEIITCRAYHFPIPHEEDDDKWRTAVLLTVMKESVRMCLLTKIGESWRATSS